MTEKDIIEAIVKSAKRSKNNDAVGRYKDWGVVLDKPLRKWISEDYYHAQAVLASHNVDLRRWSSLSCDQDDYDDFGIKFTGRHVLNSKKRPCPEKELNSPPQQNKKRTISKLR